MGEPKQQAMLPQIVVNVPAIEFNGTQYYKQPNPLDMAVVYLLGAFVLFFLILAIGAVSGIDVILTFGLLLMGLWVLAAFFMVLSYLCGPQAIRFWKNQKMKYEIVPQTIKDNPIEAIPDTLCCRSRMTVWLDGKRLGYIRKARCCENGCLYECGCYTPPSCCEGCSMCSCCGHGIYCWTFIVSIVPLILCALCVRPCYKKNKNGRKIITQKLYVNEDPEAGIIFGNTKAAYTTRESVTCCCIEIINFALLQVKIVVITVAVVLVLTTVLSVLPEDGLAMLGAAIGLLVPVVAGALLVYGLYKFIMNQKRYRQFHQDLYGPTEKDGALAGVNWVKCDAAVLAYSAQSEDCQKPGHAGQAHKGVLMAMPILNDETMSWPPPDEKLQVFNARYFFRSVNGLKVAYNEESPDAGPAWEGNKSGGESVGKSMEVGA